MKIEQVLLVALWLVVALQPVPAVAVPVIVTPADGTKPVLASAEATPARFEAEMLV